VQVLVVGSDSTFLEHAVLAPVSEPEIRVDSSMSIEAARAAALDARIDCIVANEDEPEGVWLRLLAEVALARPEVALVVVTASLSVVEHASGIGVDRILASPITEMARLWQAAKHALRHRGSTNRGAGVEKTVRAAGRFADAGLSRLVSAEKLARLTQAEVATLTLVHKGLVCKEIASALGVQTTTTRWHFRSIYPKLEVGGWVELRALLCPEAPQ
jgi:DNA-binding NarL/FixJ family response regulator